VIRWGTWSMTYDGLAGTPCVAIHISRISYAAYTNSRSNTPIHATHLRKCMPRLCSAMLCLYYTRNSLVSLVYSLGNVSFYWNL